MLSYTHQEFSYDSTDVMAEPDRPERRKKDYSRGRSYRALRKRGRKAGNTVGCGMGARRNKRYAW